jgi:hypothetical protein
MTPFEGGQPNPNASTLELVRALFEAPNRSRNAGGGRALLEDVMLAVADDLTIADAANEELDYSDTISRILLRAEWRLMLAIELARRLDEEQAEPKATNEEQEAAE